MKKTIVLWLITIMLGSPFAMSANNNEGLYEGLNKLLSEQKIPEYYATAFMAFCNNWKNPELMYYVADGYDKLGSLYRERDFLNRALTMYPDNAKFRSMLNNVEKRIERIEEKVKKLEPEAQTNERAATQLAAIYIGLKELTNARRYLNLASKLDPKKKNIIHMIMQGAYQKKLEYPTKKSIELAVKAERTYLKGDKQKAFQMFKDALSLSIISPFVYDKLGIVMLYERNFGGAIRSFEEEFAIKKESSTALAIGNIYFLLKDYTTAFDYFQKATKLNGKSSEAYYNIALCLEKLGDKKGAEKYYEIAFSQKPELKKLKNKKSPLIIKGVIIKAYNDQKK